jgi:acyl carrier protein
MTLEDLFSRVLNLPREAINDDVSQDNTREWDSMRHLELITAIEQEFATKLSTRDIYTLKSIGQVRQSLRKKGIAV